MAVYKIPNPEKRMLPRAHYWKAYINHRVLRRVIQIGVLAFIVFIAAQHVIVGEDGAAATASAEAFCPFGGLETLFKYISTDGSFVSHTHLSNLVLFAAVMAVAFFFRSAFCGWICPLGFIQDLFSNLGKVLQKRVPGVRRMFASLKQRGARLAVLDRYLRYLKYLVLVWAVGGSAYFGFMVFRDVDPWSALLSVAEFSFTPGVVVLLVTLVASFFIERPWCRYACPLGAVSGLVGKFSPTYLKRDADTCISCKLCTKACPMGLKVDTTNTIKSVDCVSCLECVSVCPREGALQVKFGVPFNQK